MKISYPGKYKEFIDEFGGEEGMVRYKKFLRQFSLEKCIIKHGEEEGRRIYEEKRNNIKNSGVTIDKLIKKYGEEEGRVRYENWKKDTRQNLENFIKRYGEEEEGRKRYESFKEKSIENFKYNLPKEKMNTSIEYWVDKYDGDIERANKEYRNRQNTSSLDKLIRKYGEEKGKVKYVDMNKRKSQTLENYIRLYGEKEGSERWEKYKNKLSYSHSKEYYIDKYGKKDGLDKWQEINLKKVNSFPNMRSNISDEFCGKIYNKIKDIYNDIYYGENEYMFFIHDKEHTIILPDMYIKDINLVIEFYGDYWHRNPRIYEGVESEKIWEKDEGRISKIKSKFKSDVIIVWEEDYMKNKKETVNKIIKIINEYGNN